MTFIKCLIFNYSEIIEKIKYKVNRLGIQTKFPFNYIINRNNIKKKGFKYLFDQGFRMKILKRQIVYTE